VNGKKEFRRTGGRNSLEGGRTGIDHGGRKKEGRISRYEDGWKRGRIERIMTRRGGEE